MWLLSPTKDTTLVENFDLIENSAVTDFSTKVVSLPHLVLTPATPL